MQTYVLGFAFTPSLNKVLLIEKTKPELQVGYLNGVGGKIEDGETPLQAMSREFEEETGLRRKKWDYFAVLKNPDYEVYCFRTITPIANCVQTTEEKLVQVRTRELLNPKYKILHNLKWLIPMAMHDVPVEPIEFLTSNLPNDWKMSRSKM